MAIDNARLYTERSRIAHTLQVKLLPERLPDIPRALMAARYRAAGELNEVGGDFYDVFQRSPTEWALVVGDVSGKGAEAAAVTALARYTLRAAALEDAPAQRRPAAAQHRDALRRHVAVRDRRHGLPLRRPGRAASTLRLALAGHPAPAVVRRDGSVEMVGRFGTMAGLRPDIDVHDVDVRLEAGDVLLLYTDGVTEAGPRHAPFGEAGPRLGALGPGRPDAAGRRRRRRAAVVAAQPGDPRDDIALLAICPTEGVDEPVQRVAPGSCRGRYGTGRCPSPASTCP